MTNEKPLVGLLPGVNIHSAINGLYLIGKKEGFDAENNALITYSSTGYIPNLVRLLESQGIQSPTDLFI